MLLNKLQFFCHGCVADGPVICVDRHLDPVVQELTKRLLAFAFYSFRLKIADWAHLDTDSFFPDHFLDF